MDVASWGARRARRDLNGEAGAGSDTSVIPLQRLEIWGNYW